MLLSKIYNPQILQCAANITHIGKLKDADITLHKKTSLCGSEITVSLKINNAKITHFSQEIKACLLAQASAAILAEHIVGSSFEDILLARKALQELLTNGKTEINLKQFKQMSILACAREYPQRHEAILLPFDACYDCFGKINEKLHFKK